ncbi:GyrI-like domain-containing protein [Arthrobacter sp. TWP1-1]|uniref:GyrI-like domain-containing protein n=1 Tax=Arthrobacter sp. TWP1-1 TaxID=2804568 RepID=UPI003CF614B9
MAKYDLKRAYKKLYAPDRKDFSLAEVPPFRYLAVDGHGDPNSSIDYAEAVTALYSVSYAAKFASKKSLNQDYVVAPLEGLWWAEDMGDFVSRKKERWDWTMMICQPQWITSERVEESIATVTAKQDLPVSAKLRLEEMEEGLCVQILHVGPYDDEAPTLDRLHNTYMPENDLQFNGKHHEIYLSDPRRTAPEKLKTVLRQPVRAIL